MKTKYIITLALIFSTTMIAQTPKWTKNAAKSIFRLTTIKADGSINASSNGFFVSNDGCCVSNYTPFVGAAKATVIDAEGKEYDVVEIMGANDMYDVAKFRINAKTIGIQIAQTPDTTDAGVWLIPYTMKHEAEAKAGMMKKSEIFDGNYHYYTFTLSAPENSVSCPIFNNSGQAIALMQQPAKQGDTLSYGVSASYVAQLKTNALSVSDPALRTLSIPLALPDEQNQAAVFLLMAASGDSLKYVQTIHSYIEKFPSATEGYFALAQLEVNNNDFEAAKRDMDTSIKVADKKDDAHYNYSKLIYQKQLYKSDKPYKEWTYERANEEAQKAYDINPQPMYKYMQANILFAQQKYDDAYNTYMALTKTSLRNAEIFYDAARCKMLSKASNDVVLALLDSTLSLYPTPYVSEAAPYLFARAQYRVQAKHYRDAVADYNEYERLKPNSLSPEFYYIREQAEAEGRLYKPALDDIQTAVQKAPNEPVYIAEQGALQLRLGMYKEAEQSARQCINVDAKYSDAYVILGMSQIHQEKKNDGLANLNKAKELGNEQADALIKKYSSQQSTK